jgi:alpha-methylacyl-CoA racemase
MTLNLKNKKVRNFVLEQIIPKCDILLESYRPGVMERFGLDPETVHKINPKIIYVRISGYGHASQNYEKIYRAGRDVNYLATAGLLIKFRRNNRVGAPTFAANILSHYASGS